eukprot:TRINITY_DN9549_c0_g1_i1.p1 TRINITY_DN9549_c0_g1~~TRINITY_DN9549_c0_g1_i1.p1  ORF type:complete len:269 (+),score=45.98 TRINITY_DN9549_c0_g1_i1:94-807(+)
MDPVAMEKSLALSAQFNADNPEPQTKLRRTDSSKGTKRQATRQVRGTGSASSSTPPSSGRHFDRMASRASTNIDNRVRALEGTCNDALTTPSTFPESQAALAAGPVYQEKVEKLGKGHGLGPPHLTAWDAFVDAVDGNPATPVELKQMIAHYRQKYKNRVVLGDAVRYFTAHKHAGRDRIILTVHVRAPLTELWNALKMFMLSRGAEQFIGTSTRAPIFRSISSLARQFLDLSITAS